MQGLKNFIIRTEHGEEHSNERTMSEVHTSAHMHAVKSYLPERGVFYRAVKVMEFLAPTYSLLLKDKHIKFYKVRNSVT